MYFFIIKKSILPDNIEVNCLKFGPGIKIDFPI